MKELGNPYIMNIVGSIGVMSMNVSRGLIDYLSSMRYPLYIKEIEFDTETFLKIYYKEYLRNLTKYVPDKKTLIKVKNSCSIILRCINLYKNNLVREAYDLFFDLMDKVANDLTLIELGNDFSSKMYRLRPGKKMDKYKLKDMFYVPLSKRNKISQSRYSIQGIPCLYLTYSSSIVVPWYECDCPQEFYYAQFEINNEILNSYKVLNFSINLMHRYFTSSLYSDLDKFSGRVYHDMITIPFRSACSIVIENDLKSYKEEYIIPQMVMSWIRKSADFIGVAYSSCDLYADNSMFSHTNFAFAVKDTKRIYDPTLRKIFMGLKSKSYTINYLNILKKVEERVDTNSINLVRAFYFEKKYKMQTYQYYLEYSEMLQLLSAYINYITKLANTKDVDLKALSDNFKLYRILSEKICERFANLLGNEQVLRKTLFRDDDNIDEVRNEYESTLHKFRQIIDLPCFNLDIDTMISLEG